MNEVKTEVFVVYFFFMVVITINMIIKSNTPRITILFIGTSLIGVFVELVVMLVER